MKFLLISAIAATVVLASAATVLRSHTRIADRPGAGAMSLQDIYAAVNVNKLPVENFEDRFETWSAAKR
jgi:hypothetical protein